MSRISRMAPTYAPSHFNPHSGRVHLAPKASRYEIAHEKAHLAQMALPTRTWRLYSVTTCIPFVCRLTRVMVEWQAARMAIRGLEEVHQCSDSSRREARAESAWYLSSLFVSEETATKIRKWIRC